MHNFFKLLLIINIFFLSLHANTISLNDNQLSTLSKNKTWLKLLHYKNSQSDLLTNDFFLSKKGKYNPKEELKETIKAYFDTKYYKRDNSHPRCKFPARYLWLSKNINLPSFKNIEPYCTKLLKWPIIKEADAISLILVSGYLGNPASTFGHSFIKLNSKNNKQGSLFDLSINYGALVPEKEPIIKYIYKGIFGGYEAGFSDKYFYTQDLIYSHSEFRDMWEYKLNLTKEQKDLIIFHFWEIIGKKFQYYFLSENCAYKVSEALELVLDEPIVRNDEKWYAPVETFNTLEEINKKNKIISSIQYIPSSQRIIYKKYSLLTKEEKSITLKLIENSFKNLDKTISGLKVNTKINIINFLLEYQKYLLIKNPKDTEIKGLKNKFLLKRLALPVKKIADLNIKDLTSPAKGNKPIVLKIGTNKIKDKNIYNTLGFTIFALESLGKNSLNFDELIVADVNFGFKLDNKNIFLDSFDLIKIKKLKYSNFDWNEDLNLSWKLNIGSRLIYDERKSKNRYDSFVNASIGKTLKINDNIYTYFMLDGTLHDAFPYLSIKPNINLDYKIKDLKSSFSLGHKFNPYNNDNNISIEIASQYKIIKDLDFKISYKKDTYSKTAIEFKWFF